MNESFISQIIKVKNSINMNVDDIGDKTKEHLRKIDDKFTCKNIGLLDSIGLLLILLNN